MPKNQSAYRRGHSTETAVLRIVNDLIESVASGRMALICLLDLSAAFDTVDHGILVERLERSYGLKGTALEWIRNFLADRSQTVCWIGSTSAPGRVDCGVPQSSVFGPLLFVLYTADISRIIESLKFSMHAYADNVQAYSSFQPLRPEFEDYRR